MTKSIQLDRNQNIEAHIFSLRMSARKTQSQIFESAKTMNPLQFLFQLKFEKIGCDPLLSSRDLNLIEQLNQTFTYLASFRAAEFLFANHADIHKLNLNLGTQSGSDIETEEKDLLIAEVFASVDPMNNRKLLTDIERIRNAPHKYRYVFFMSPKFPAGSYEKLGQNSGVAVLSLGCEL